MFAAVWTGPECFAGGGLERAVCTECRTVVPPSGWRLSYVKTLLLLPVVLPTLTLSVYPPLRWTQECDRHRKWSTEKLTDTETYRQKHALPELVEGKWSTQKLIDWGWTYYLNSLPGLILQAGERSSFIEQQLSHYSAGQRL